MSLISLTDEDILKLDSEIHVGAYTDDNFIKHIDLMAELEARGLKHEDSSAFTKATEWWLNDNSRFEGDITLSKAQAVLPGACFTGAIMAREKVNKNEYIDVIVNDNDEVLLLTSKCADPDILSRLRFTTGKKPSQVLSKIKTLSGKNDSWFKWVGKRISKGLIFAKSTGDRIQIVRKEGIMTVHDYRGIDITKTVEPLVSSLPDGEYVAEVSGKKVVLCDYITDTAKYVERYAILSDLVKESKTMSVPELIPISAQVSFSKEINSNSWLWDTEDNELVYLMGPFDKLEMSQCVFALDLHVCPIKRGTEYPVTCSLGDSYICPYVKEIYYDNY